MFWGYLGLFIIGILYRKILHTIRSKLQSRSRFFIDCSDQSHDLWKWRNLCLFIFQFTWLLNNHHRYSRVKLYTNRSVLYSTGFFFLISLYSLINVLQDTTYKLNTVYISQYMSRSSIIAMTNHMIIMVCESDSCMFVFTCIMQNRYYYIWYNHHSLSNHKWFFFIIMYCYPCPYHV